MKNIAWSLMVLIAGSSSAYANVWDDYRDSYEKEFNAVTSENTQEKARADEYLHELQAKAGNVQNQQAKDSTDLDRENKEVASLEKTESAIERELSDLQASAPPAPTGPFHLVKSQQQKEIERQQKKLADIQQRLAEEKDKQKQAEQTLKGTHDSLQKMQKSAADQLAEVNKLDGIVKRSSSPEVQLSLAKIQARDLFEAQRQNTFDSKLLLTDLQVLQQKNKLSSLEAQALQQSWDTQLNGTLMGQYVNNQIQKAVASTCDPEFQNACAAKNVAGLNAVISGKLNPPNSGAQPQASSAAAPTKAITAPTGLSDDEEKRQKDLYSRGGH